MQYSSICHQFLAMCHMFDKKIVTLLPVSKVCDQVHSSFNPTLIFLDAPAHTTQKATRVVAFYVCLIIRLLPNY